MLRPPTGGSGSGTNKQEPSSSLDNKNSLRPPTGQMGLNQIQELHQNNRLKRPDTGNATSKPPMAQRPGQLGDDDDYYMNNSQITSGQGQKNQAFEVTATQADFERDAEVDLNEQYGDETGSDAEEDSEEDGAFYQPTLIAKTKPTKSKKKKQVKKSASKMHEIPTLPTQLAQIEGGH